MDDFVQLPKAELHLHLGGSYPLPYLLSVATPAQQEALLQGLDTLSKRVEYQDAFRFFQIIGQIVHTEERLQGGTAALCRALEKDGVVYAEIRTGLKQLGGTFESYLQAVLAGIEDAGCKNLEVALLLSLQRASSLEIAKATIDLALAYQHLGVVGIDLSGDSTLGAVERILPELLRAKREGLFLTLHVGESPDEREQEQLLEALQPDRVGHGVHLTQKAKEWILAHQTPLEVCLTSSFLAKMVDEVKDHPGFSYFKQGHPIVFCTDDPLLFSTTLSQELALAESQGGLSKEEIARIVNNSFRYAMTQLSK